MERPVGQVVHPWCRRIILVKCNLLFLIVKMVHFKPPFLFYVFLFISISCFHTITQNMIIMFHITLEIANFLARCYPLFLMLSPNKIKMFPNNLCQRSHIFRFFLLRRLPLVISNKSKRSPLFLLLRISTQKKRSFLGKYPLPNSGKKEKQHSMIPADFPNFINSFFAASIIP